MKTTFLSMLSVLAAGAAQAEVRLPAIFSTHAVLQADAAVPVWGWADAGEEVKVAFGGQQKTVKTGVDGKWSVKLDALKAGQAGVLTVEGKNKITVDDVLVGEVWLASGQSNMEFPFHSCGYPPTVAAEAELPQVRMFTVKRASARTPQEQCEGTWVVSNAKSVESFSAVAYFFGKNLHETLKVPVGMVHSSWGGTDIAAWTSEEAQMKNATLKGKLEYWAKTEAAYDAAKAKEVYDKHLAGWQKRMAEDKSKAGRKPEAPAHPDSDRNHPANLYNGMIAPLIPYALRGAIWYQGEHNCGSVASAELYATQLPMLITDWRARWASDLPFAWVQLPGFTTSPHRPLVREAMLKTLSVKNTGMAVTVDIGEAANNHPKNKHDVGKRLALWARATVYGEKLPDYSGPLPSGHAVKGAEMVLSFDHAAGLEAKGGALTGFEVAGEDKQWKPGTAKIEGSKVVVSNAEIATPAAVRYGWAATPEGNLFNGAGLPASPFRTDDWKIEELAPASKPATKK